jgi:tRNA(adenine34) deaminase
MRLAIDLAVNSSRNTGDVPVGAVILDGAGEIVGMGTNEREFSQDPTAHAEMVAIRNAADGLHSWRLENHTLVVTLEPCSMCAGAIAQARIPRLVFGAWDEKAGAVGSIWDVLRDPRALYKVEVTTGVLADECAQLLRTFFLGQRQRN